MSYEQAMGTNGKGGVAPGGDQWDGLAPGQTPQDLVDVVNEEARGELPQGFIEEGTGGIDTLIEAAGSLNPFRRAMARSAIRGLVGDEQMMRNLQTIIANAPEDQRQGVIDRRDQLRRIASSADYYTIGIAGLAVVGTIGAAGIAAARYRLERKRGRGELPANPRPAHKYRYPFYVVAGNRIESAWDYREDAKDRVAELKEDSGIRSRVISAKGLQRLSIDAAERSSWANVWEL